MTANKYAVTIPVSFRSFKCSLLPSALILILRVKCTTGGKRTASNGTQISLAVQRLEAPGDSASSWQDNGGSAAFTYVCPPADCLYRFLSFLCSHFSLCHADELFFPFTYPHNQTYVFRNAPTILKRKILYWHPLFHEGPSRSMESFHCTNGSLLREKVL